jgi:predicted MPP superfamily phosphohydrolase
MKVLFISDIHGKTDWRWIFTQISQFDKIVFIGDYVDSFTHTSKDIEDNLRSIIALKIQYMDKVVALIGNHDYAYVFGKNRTSGFRPEEYHDLKELFEKNWHLFDVAWGYKSLTKLNKRGLPQYTLATHAGLTQTFKSYFVDNEFKTKGTVINRMYDTEEDYKLAPMHEVLNYLKDNITLMWIVGYVRGGVNKTGSVVWADKSEVIKDRYVGINQVIGHTSSYFMEVNEKAGDNLYFIDKRSDETTFSLLLDL